MAGLDQHLKYPEYANWVKNTLAQKITLDVLKPYVDKELTNIQASITDKCPPGAACSSCNVYTASDCPNNVCNVFKNEIMENHRVADPSFLNANAKKWKTDVWEIAKCFMPPTEGYKYCSQLDADFSAVINIIINCKHFDTLVSCDLNRNGNMFCEARTMRNMLMHSDSLKVSEANFQENLDLLISLLSCFNDIPPNSPEAKEKIKKLKTGEPQVTLNNVLDARAQVAYAIWEEMDDRKKEITDYVDLLIAKLRQEIETATPTLNAQRHRLIGNFIKGCKLSLIRLVESEGESAKPKIYQQHKWNFEEFLDVKSLLHRHQRLLYPEDGSPSDIKKWDIFLLCHTLSVITSDERPNNLVNYVRLLKETRNNILKNPDSIREKDLEELSGFLDEPLGTEIKSIFAGEDVTDDALQLESVLKSWQQNEENMECKQPGIKALEENKKLAKRIEEVERRQGEDRDKINKLSEEFGKITTQFPKLQKQIDGVSEEIRKSRSSGNIAEGKGNIIEACAEIKPINVDPEEKEQIQNNITSENMDENIAFANGGFAYFQEQTNLEPVKTNKGSIILKVQCKSIKELIRFWDICIDGSAVRALSKIRDDYRRIFGCQTLEFDLVLSKKEVHRCMNHLVDRMSSQSLDQSILTETQAKVTMLGTFLATAEDSSEEIGESTLDEDVRPGKDKDLSQEAPKLSLLEDIKTGSSSTLPLMKDMRHREEEASGKFNASDRWRRLLRKVMMSSHSFLNQSNTRKTKITKPSISVF